MNGSDEGRQRQRRGFNTLPADRQREIASHGGKAVPAGKRSFSRDRDLASAAGRKGGLLSGGRRRGEA